MKAVLISIQPKWCELMASGKKTIEVRKTRPKIDTPFKCYIYTTKLKSNFVLRRTQCCGLEIAYMNKHTKQFCGEPKRWDGKVIGEFICNNIDEIICSGGIPCIFYDGELYDDVCEKSCLSIKDVWEYANNKPIYGWNISDLKIYDEPKRLSEFLTTGKTAWGFGKHYLSRSPQSYCFVEELR